VFHCVHLCVVLLLCFLGESNDAAGNFASLALFVAAEAIWSIRMLSLIKVIFSFVDGHGLTDDGVGSAQVNKEVSVLVLGVGVEAGLDLLNVTDAACMDVLVGVSMVGTEGVINAANGLTAVLQVAKFVNFQGVKTGLEALELSNHGGKIVRLLDKLEATL
jgi:hypothetical protein